MYNYVVQINIVNALLIFFFTICIRMGNYETHDLAPVRDDERKELNLSRKVTYKQFCKVRIN